MIRLGSGGDAVRAGARGGEAVAVGRCGYGFGWVEQPHDLFKIVL